MDLPPILISLIVGRKIEQQNNTTELAGYVDRKIVKGLLIINPSFKQLLCLT